MIRPVPLGVFLINFVFTFCMLYFCQSIPATVNGMLGGYARISPTDIKDSKKFLKSFLEVSEAFT